MKKRFLIALMAIIISLGTSNVTSNDKVTNLSNSTFEIKNKFKTLSTSFDENATSQVKFEDSEIANLGLVEMNHSSNDTLNSIDSFSKVRDLNGDEFLYVNYKPFGYSVIDLTSYTTIEMNPFSTRKNEIKSNEIYYPVIGIVKESKDGKEYVDSRGGKYEKEMFKKSMNAFSSSLFNNLNSRKQETINSRIALLNNPTVANNDKGNGGDSGNNNFDWVIDINKKEIKADVEVPYSWFFKYNKNQFAYSNGGSNGICEYIAFLLMMSYNDFFVSKGYFSDEEISKYVTTNRGSSFKNAIPNVSDSFATDLFDKNDNKETLNIGALNSLFNLFMKDKTSVSAKTVSAYWVFGNPKDVINKGRPDMLCGYFPDIGDRGDIGHNIVAYGYFNEGEFNGKYLTHYGWDNDTQCIVDRGIFSTGYDWSIEDSTKNKNKRYIFDVNGSLRCGSESTNGD